MGALASLGTPRSRRVHSGEARLVSRERHRAWGHRHVDQTAAGSRELNFPGFFLLLLRITEAFDVIT